MSNPFGIGDMAGMGLPGGNPMQGTGILETMELVRKAWASFSLPPAMAPTVDPDEIARRIAELKAVEQWLSMNLTMLRGTIQGLEIQQVTLAAIHAFGAAGASSMAAAQAATAADPSAAAPPGAAEASAEAAEGERAGAQQATDNAQADALNPVAWWDMLQKQFGQVASAALAGMPAAIDAASGAMAAASAQAGATAGEATSAPAAGKAPPTVGKKTTARRADKPAGKPGAPRTAPQSGRGRRPAGKG